MAVFGVHPINRKCSLTLKSLLEWVSDFAGQMNCCYFCDCRENFLHLGYLGVVTICFIKQVYKKHPPLPNPLVAVVLTFRNEVLVKLVEASFTFVFLKQ